MEVLKKLAPKYWLGYYLVYIMSVIGGAVRYSDSLIEPTGNEDLYTMAAIFGVATGIAATSAVTAEVVGYVVLLIPNRIKQIRNEGRAEGRDEGRAEGRDEGRAEGRAEELERVSRLRARYESGEITLNELLDGISNNHCRVCERPR